MYHVLYFRYIMYHVLHFTYIMYHLLYYKYMMYHVLYHKYIMYLVLYTVDKCIIYHVMYYKYIIYRLLYYIADLKHNSKTPLFLYNLLNGQVMTLQEASREIEEDPAKIIRKHGRKRKTGIIWG